MSDSIVCKNGYDYYYVNGMLTAKKLPKGATAFYSDGTIQSCTESYKLTDGKCVLIADTTFTEHCIIRNQGESYESASCEQNWDYCKKGDTYHAIKLPPNTSTIANDCVTIKECVYGYVLDTNTNKCIQSN